MHKQTENEYRALLQKSLYSNPEDVAKYILALSRKETEDDNLERKQVSNEVNEASADLEENMLENESEEGLEEDVAGEELKQGEDAYQEEPEEEHDQGGEDEEAKEENK